MNRQSIFLTIYVLLIGSYALAQSGLTIDQVEAQVVALQAQLVPAISGQPPTIADQISALNAEWGQLQQCCLKDQSNFALLMTGSNSTMANVSTLQNQMATANLQLSTVGVLTQLGLDNQTNIQTMQAQITALQAQVAALAPTSAAVKRGITPQQKQLLIDRNHPNLSCPFKMKLPPYYPDSSQHQPPIHRGLPTGIPSVIQHR